MLEELKREGCQGTCTLCSTPHWQLEAEIRHHENPQELTEHGLQKCWLGIESVALRMYNDTADPKYLLAALDARIHLNGIGVKDSAVARLESKVAELQAQLRQERDRANANADQMKADAVKFNRLINNLESQVAQLTKERDEYKFMYEGLCK